MNGKKILFIILLFLLCLPIIQHAVDFPKVAKLKGYFLKNEKPDLSFEGFYSGDFQIKFDKYLE
ncbi:MAG: hypothetical protein KAQ75_03775, partial [Bacteroidales bacterium]|nr:hypothetical protein [Bacteroidales bacterium]